MQQGLLPESVVQAYLRSSMRQEITNIIKMSIDRIPGKGFRFNTYGDSAAAAELNVTN